MIGSVFGMTTMVVTPPAAAAALAEFQRFAMLASGFPGEHPHVDQAGREHCAAAVHDLGVARQTVLKQPWTPFAQSVAFDTSNAPGASRPEAGSTSRA